jgi:predicted DNA-binding protein with PD1-like motif
MKAFIGSGIGKILVINLHRGELLLETIVEQLAQEKIRTAVVLTAIGTLERASFHRVLSLDENPRDEYFTLDAPFELSSMQGLILDGQPHIHLTINDLNRAYAVHLEPGSSVLYTAEIVIAEILGEHDYKRVKKENGIPEFSLVD